MTDGCCSYQTLQVDTDTCHLLFMIPANLYMQVNIILLSEGQVRRLDIRTNHVQNGTNCSSFFTPWGILIHNFGTSMWKWYSLRHESLSFPRESRFMPLSPRAVTNIWLNTSELSFILSVCLCCSYSHSWQEPRMMWGTYCIDITWYRWARPAQQQFASTLQYGDGLWDPPLHRAEPYPLSAIHPQGGRWGGLCIVMFLKLSGLLASSLIVHAICTVHPRTLF
jgi:hypothetical protein